MEMERFDAFEFCNGFLSQKGSSKNINLHIISRQFE
jgi:hypothetical protein